MRAMATISNDAVITGDGIAAGIAGGALAGPQCEFRAGVALAKQSAKRMYPIAENWDELFRPHIPAVHDTMRRAIGVVRYDFDPTIHIPREAGRFFPAQWPRTRDCCRAFQMSFYCHMIAAVVLDLARHAEPAQRWHVAHAQHHTVVESADGAIIDINNSHGPPDETLKRVRRDIFRLDHVICHDLDGYIDRLITDQMFGPPKPMPKWFPYPGGDDYNWVQQRAAE